MSQGVCYAVLKKEAIMLRREFLNSTLAGLTSLLFFPRTGEAKSKYLALFTCMTAGFKYHEGVEIIKRLKPGTHLRLQRKTGNKYDNLAVAVYTRDGKKLGYIPHTLNEVPAAHLDNGHDLYAISPQHSSRRPAMADAGDYSDDTGENMIMRNEKEQKKLITSKLRELEKSAEITILYACESGSRVWGFASRDSDWDIRFIYIRPREWCLSIDLERKRDVIEMEIENDLDISGWDIRKALQLFQKTNPPLIEWLHSPIIYIWLKEIIGNIYEAIPYGSKNTCMYFGLC